MTASADSGRTVTASRVRVAVESYNIDASPIVARGVVDKTDPYTPPAT